MSNTGLLLTPEEKARFVQWLELEASTAEGLIAQMEKLPGMAINALYTQREKQYAIAARLIADRQRRTQSVTLG